MDQFDDTLHQLKDSSGGMKPNLHILDEIIPVEEQMKYFQYSKYVQSEKGHISLDRNYLIARLFTPDVDIEDRRYYLAVLAGLVDVAAYRAIEAYHSSPLEPDLSGWSAMALIESKLLLDAELSGERQYFVSTGLGGYNGMLRFFSIIASADRTEFTDLQKDILRREIQFAFERDKIQLEDLIINKNYVKILLLCDIDHDAKTAIEAVIKECNDLGNFIDTRFVLTNVKKIEDADIEKMLNTDKDSSTE